MAKKFILIFVLIILYPVIAEGVEWMRVTDVDNFYVDVGSITQISPVQYQAWSKTEFDSAASIKEVRIHSLYHCSERKVRELRGIVYYKDGSIHEEGIRDWHYVVPGSNYEKSLDFVCTYKNKKGVLKIPLREDN